MLHIKLVASLVLVVAFVMSLPLSTSADSFAEPAFAKLWEKTDKSVAEGDARTWTWGPLPLATVKETYGKTARNRLVQYFDKGRMEINDPAGDRNSPWFVTSGLLVKEMISGQIQVADDLFSDYAPAGIPLVGDPRDNPSPTYASLRFIASLKGDRRVANKVDQPVTETIDAAGVIGKREGMDADAVFKVYEEATGHNIPDVFWDFLTNPGGKDKADSSENKNPAEWISLTGYPLTEPYWITAKIGGEEKEVLVQAFERRVLTFTPNSPKGWQVEMGNVGLHYYRWRHQSTVALGTKYQVYDPFAAGPCPWEIQVIEAKKAAAPVAEPPGGQAPQGTSPETFVVIQLTAQNGATQPMAIEPGDFVLRDATGHEYAMVDPGSQSGGFPGYKGHAAGWLVPNGESGDYVLVFQVPQEAEGLVFAPHHLDQPAVSLGF